MFFDRGTAKAEKLYASGGKGLRPFTPEHGGSRGSVQLAANRNVYKVIFLRFHQKGTSSGLKVS